MNLEYKTVLKRLQLADMLPLGVERIVVLPLSDRSNAQSTFEKTVLYWDCLVLDRESSSTSLQDCWDSRILGKGSDGEISAVAPAPYCHLLLVNKWIFANLPAHTKDKQSAEIEPIWYSGRNVYQNELGPVLTSFILLSCILRLFQNSRFWFWEAVGILKVYFGTEWTNLITVSMSLVSREPSLLWTDFLHLSPCPPLPLTSSLTMM